MANYSNRYFSHSTRSTGNRSGGSRFPGDGRGAGAPSPEGRSVRPRSSDARPSAYEGNERGGAPRRQFRLKPPFILGAILLVTLLVIVLSIAISRASARRAARYAAENPPYTTIAPGETAPALQATADESSGAEPAPGTEETDGTDGGAAQRADEPSAEAEGDYVLLEGIPNTNRAVGLAEGPQVDNGYFDDAVFVGDAATLTLGRYVRDWRGMDYPSLLGKAQFLTLEHLSSRGALEPVSGASQHPVYQGDEMRIEDAVAAMGAGKVYLMLGSNDIAADGVETSATNLMLLARKIKDKSPNILIFIQSVTPILRENGDGLTNEAILQYNLRLYEYCQRYASYGLYFVDAAYPLRDARGNLAAQYCGDAQGQGRSLSAEACRVWITYLYTHTPR